MHLQVALAGGSGGWTLSLPHAGSGLGPATVQCTGPPGACLVGRAPPCAHAGAPIQASARHPGGSGALPTGEVSVQSVQSGGGCSAGQPSPDQLNGTTLLYGLQVLLPPLLTLCQQRHLMLPYFFRTSVQGSLSMADKGSRFTHLFCKGV